MAIAKKSSRNITVDGHDFKWSVKGTDMGISVIAWPVCNDDCRVVGWIDYHHDWKEDKQGHYTSQSQLIVSNRIVREVILKVGVKTMLANHGQINIGDIAAFYDISNALRSCSRE